MKDREEKRGVFWVIDGKLLAFPFSEADTEGLSKSGHTYNHKKLWLKVRPAKCGKPYNYYPRGRVEFSGSGVPIIYLNPNIDKSLVEDIRRQFGLRSYPKIHFDGSDHYKCYLDDGYVQNE